jgi:cytochrome c553
MKSLLTSFLSLVVLISFFAFQSSSNDNQPNMSVGDFSLTDVPEDVQAILDNSCLPCHGADGQGKAKLKWNWEKMPELTTSKQVSKLSKVVDEVNEDKMPKPKYLKKHPEAKLSDEQKKVLVDWAERTAEGLVSAK